MPRSPRPAPLRRAALALLLAVAPAVVAAGCTKDPILKVQGAAISGATVALPLSIGLIMAVNVAAENPNSFDIQVQGVRGQVSMLNQNLTINTALGVWLRSDTTTSFTVPVTVPLPTALALLGSSLNIACIPYSMSGSADVVATSTFKLDKPNYPMSQSGCIPRAMLLAAVRPYNPAVY